MRLRLPTIKLFHGETDHILLSGKVIRRPTILIRVGKLSLSKKAFILGAALCICQLLDGLLTYVGLSLLGVHMEGNRLLKSLMISYGMEPALFFAKLFAVIIAVILAIQAHRRRWIRPILAGIVGFYIMLAVVPWTYYISQHIRRDAKSRALDDLIRLAQEKEAGIGFKSLAKPEKDISTQDR